jgi:hypothetical protein
MRAAVTAILVLSLFPAVVFGGRLLVDVWEVEQAAAARQIDNAPKRVGDEQPKVRFNAADQAAARAAVLKRTDLAGSGWSGGRQEVDFSGSPCADFRPKQSDLVVTGAARSAYKHRAGVAFTSEIWVMQTRAMVQRDWQRVIESGGFLRCARTTFAKEATRAGGRLVSMKRIAFPRLARYTVAYRAVLDVPRAGRLVRVMIDMVQVGGNRTELSFTVIAPYAGRAAVLVAEKRLLRRILSRSQA